MATYLLTWNPTKWAWTDLPKAADEVAERGEHVRQWSCGNTKRIEAGDRLFLLRQGREPRGIVASGHARSSTYEAEHWDDDKDSGTFVDVGFDTIQDPETEPILPRARLNGPEFEGVYWDPPASGWPVPEPIAAALEAAWTQVVEGRESGGSINSDSRFHEGTARAISLNVYERNPQARAACIAHYGPACVVCDMDFGVRYGPEAEGYIHVHHLRPVASIGSRYDVDPVRDLRPVCPNCHAVIHQTTPPRPPEEVRTMLAEQAT